jgi:hypothetical protein
MHQNTKGRDSVNAYHVTEIVRRLKSTRDSLGDDATAQQMYIGAVLAIDRLSLCRHDASDPTPDVKGIIAQLRKLQAWGEIDAAAHISILDMITEVQNSEFCPCVESASPWSEEPPTEQGWYWHWNGDSDSKPIPTSVLYSGTSNTCFVSIGQLGIVEATDCSQYGGFWSAMEAPAVPNRTHFNSPAVSL